IRNQESAKAARRTLPDYVQLSDQPPLPGSGIGRSNNLGYRPGQHRWKQSGHNHRRYKVYPQSDEYLLPRAGVLIASRRDCRAPNVSKPRTVLRRAEDRAPQFILQTISARAAALGIWGPAPALPIPRLAPVVRMDS